MMTPLPENDEAASPQWTSIEAIDRRVLGVLIEKAKTTPSSYPLTLNAIKSGANQKSNRFPQMEVNGDQIEDSLDRLRIAKAVSFVEGDGRVPKYRHLAYDWLGVSKVEMAVMAELLMRGVQTTGELRGRAARMEPIQGMSELTPLLASLQAKSLVVYLTPPGRGAMVTHNLYLPREMEKVQREHGSVQPATTSIAASDDTPTDAAVPPVTPAHTPPTKALQEPTDSPEPSISPEPAGAVDRLRQEVAGLRSDFSEFRDKAETQLDSLRTEIDDLNRQLGN